MVRSTVRFALSLLTLSAFALPSFAQGESCTRRGIAEKLGLAEDQVELGQATEKPLYLALDKGFKAGDHLTVSIRRLGQDFGSENLELIAQQVESAEKGQALDLAAVSAIPVVELFANHPARLAVLRQAPHEFELVITRNGKTQKTATFPQLDSESAALAQGHLAPQPLRSTLRTPSAERPLQKSACTDACYDELNDCNYYHCGQFGGELCYGNCHNLYEDCLEYNCSTCTPSSSTTTTFTQVSLTGTSTYECHTASGFYPKGIYRWSVKQVKKTVTTTTINSDCSETVSTVITYFNVNCWVYTYSDPGCFSLGDVLLQLC